MYGQMVVMMYFIMDMQEGLKQAREMGDKVIIGVHTNKDIEENKSLPVLFDNERVECVKACRWVDEVVLGSPFVTNIDIVKKYGCDIIMHGNDPISDVSGEDCYAYAKKMNMFREFDRTPTTSTTNIIGRMLLRKNKIYHVDSKRLEEYEKELALPKKERNGKIGYIFGTFDLYHAGHAAILKEAKNRCDYLILGLFTDKKVKEVENIYPLLNYKERKLTLLSNRYIDEIIEAPAELNIQFIEENKIEKIYKGKILNKNYKDELYLIEKNKIEEIETEYSYLTAEVIAKRVCDNYTLYEERQRKRGAK
ncbi:Phosphoethanolamine cytidylyltransferase [Spraguea lophii 42_110]|uniref:ethanolamine-phosphate cytidylyltransferase n=1 Tax=Spraguea lophii (strain 42_110) TaxID=1358809 RepID=S7W8F9_SPRLO|nr:Phosphoethanolamine cytidylyltransferase [Spraguea lophii 42_110]